jgi:CRP-like cAMP-binding protein
VNSSGPPPIDKLLSKLRLFDDVSEAEDQALRGSVSRLARFNRGDVIIPARTELNSCTILLSGFVHRFRDLSDGRRQSMELSVPGDFIDLHSYLMKRIDHDIGCLSPVKVAFVPHERLAQISEEFPHLGRLLWLHTLIDAAIHREWIVSLGARSSVERMAHLFCEVATRLEAIGLGDRSGYHFPLTQSDLAELMGLSLVHVNRTLRELRERELIVFKEQKVQILNWDGMVSLAQFDPFYLGMHRRPR